MRNLSRFCTACRGNSAPAQIPLNRPRSNAASQPTGARPNGPPPAAVETVSRLDGNIGYLKINGFPPRDVIGPRLTEAMKELNNTDALIIDLRDNRGGAPGGAMYLAGHFFEKRTLVGIFSRDPAAVSLRCGRNESRDRFTCTRRSTS